MNNKTDKNMNSKKEIFKIGTRGSKLALWQSRHVAEKLDVETELTVIKTSGDRFQDIPLQGQSETGFFTKEIENQLLDGRIDLAVHSLKDLPTRPHPDLALGAYLVRAEVSDVLLVHPDWYDPDVLIPVREGCKVGATSLRRQALLRLYGPQAVPAMLRGNVPTRVEKCKNGLYGAIVLAEAGIRRLELDTQPLLMFRLNPDIWLPAPGQGVIAVQTRGNHNILLDAVKKLDNPAARGAVTIERELLANFEGGCHTAFGAYARPDRDRWITHIGLEEPGKGWGQVTLPDRTVEEVTSITPGDLNNFAPVVVANKETLCRKIR